MIKHHFKFSTFLLMLLAASVLASVMGAGLAAISVLSASMLKIVAWSFVLGFAFSTAAAVRYVLPPPEDITEPELFRGTRRMSARLREMYESKDMNTYWLLMVPFARIFKLSRYFSTRKDAKSIRARVGVRAKDAEYLVLQGKTEEAIAEYLEIKRIAEAYPSKFKKPFFDALNDSLATAYLRLGEQRNCIARHTADSCILPIAGGGLHLDRDPSRAAVETYLALLKDKPDDMGNRWLLNLAYMTLGEYPEKVPPQYLIPMDLFSQRRDIGRFKDVAAEVGLDLRGLAGGVVVDDFDGDGYLDVFLSGWELGQQIRYFHNNGDGTFTERTEEAGLTGLTGGQNILQADYNNDGHVDLLVLRGCWQFEWGLEPMSLLRNNGDGTFDDVTVEAGLLSLHATQAAVFADFHNHGRLDLFVGYESVTPSFIWNVLKSKVLRRGVPWRIPAIIPRRRCALYRNNGDGTFTDVAREAGVDVIGLVKGVAAGDYNNDGWTDLYISQFGSPNILFKNNGRDASGKISFTDVTKKAGVEGGLFSFATWFFDFDNDGWLDIYAADLTERIIEAPDAIADECLGKKHKVVQLYRNNRDGTFTDVTKQAGLDKSIFQMGANYGDLDNDGYPDLYLGTGMPSYRAIIPNRMFKNVEGKRFEEVTTPGGFGHVQKGHAIAFADINENGHQDVLITLGGVFTGDLAMCALFENPADNGNHWVKLKLEGTKSNRSAIGARLRVTVETKDGKTRDIYSTVTTGGSFGGNPLRREIGLGRASVIKNIEIKWPASGIVQNFKDVEIDRFYRVTEGEPALVPVHLASFKYGGGMSLSRPKGQSCCGERRSGAGDGETEGRGAGEGRRADERELAHCAD